MSEISTIASLATAGGTLVLAIATFSSTRSANRAARISEQALSVGLRPVLFNARAQDAAQKVGYIDDHWVLLRDGLAAAQHEDGNLYVSVPLRNVGSGLAVLHGWYLWTERTEEHPPTEHFRRLTRDLYVPAGDIGFCQAALRDESDQLYRQISESLDARATIGMDVLYGDHEGGQHTITRFMLRPRDEGAEDPHLWMCTTARHWNLDRADPR